MAAASGLVQETALLFYIIDGQTSIEKVADSIVAVLPLQCHDISDFEIKFIMLLMSV